MDKLLAVAVSPEDMPAKSSAGQRLVLERLDGSLCQGFAPFGVAPMSGAEPICASNQRLCFHPYSEPGGVPRASHVQRPLRYCAKLLYCPAPPFQAVAVGGRVIIAVRVPEERTIVAVENEADDLRGLNEVERFVQQFARRPVSRHDQEESIDPFPDDTAVRDRDERRRVQQDVVVLAPRLPEKLPESWRFQELVF